MELPFAFGKMVYRVDWFSIIAIRCLELHVPGLSAQGLGVPELNVPGLSVPVLGVLVLDTAGLLVNLRIGWISLGSFGLINRLFYEP